MEWVVASFLARVSPPQPSTFYFISSFKYAHYIVSRTTKCNIFQLGPGKKIKDGLSFTDSKIYQFKTREAIPVVDKYRRIYAVRHRQPF